MTGGSNLITFFGVSEQAFPSIRVEKEKHPSCIAKARKTRVLLGVLD